MTNPNLVNLDYTSLHRCDINIKLIIVSYKCLIISFFFGDVLTHVEYDFYHEGKKGNLALPTREKYKYKVETLRVDARRLRNTGVDPDFVGPWTIEFLTHNQGVWGMQKTPSTRRV